MKMITKKLRGLVFCLAFFAALTLAGRVEAQAAGTISMTIERFSIGGNFIMEPRTIEIQNGDNYATLITRVLKNELKVNYSFTGTPEKDFYLAGISGYTMTPNPPDAVKKVLLANNIDYLTDDAEPTGQLSQFDYSPASGWMYYVNDQWMNGMSTEHPQNGDVCRLMFTMFYGADIEGRSVQAMAPDGVEINEEKYYDRADKAELIRKMAAMNADKSSWQSNADIVNAYNNAVAVIAKFDAKQNDVTEALAMLNGSSGQTGEMTLFLNPTSLSLNVGESRAIQATVSSSDNASVTWTSSNPDVASVDKVANGAYVTATAPGTATITATAKSGSQTATASCAVTVAGDFTKGAPMITSVKADSATSVTISWEAYPGAESYTVLRQEIGGSFTPIKDGVTGTNYTDKTAKADTTYFYSVRAVKGSETSDYERGRSVDTPAETKKPGEVSIKSVTSAAYNKLKITWGKVDGATGYYVQRSTSKNGSYKRVGTVSAASYTDSGLTAGKTYYYKVQAYNDSGEGTISAAKSGKPVPAAPKVSVTAGKKQAKVKWKKISGASGYVVYRSTSKSKGYKAVKTIKKGSTVSWKNTKLKSKKTYYYKVRAYRTVSGKKVYSGYSSVVGKKIK